MLFGEKPFQTDRYSSSVPAFDEKCFQTDCYTSGVSLIFFEITRVAIAFVSSSLGKMCVVQTHFLQFLCSLELFWDVDVTWYDPDLVTGILIFS